VAFSPKKTARTRALDIFSVRYQVEDSTVTKLWNQYTPECIQAYINQI